MLLNLTYPAFLRGTPARHHGEKACLVALEVEVDVSEVEAYAAPVVMALSDRVSHGSIELRSFGGRLYRSLGITPEDLPRYTKSNALDTRSDMLGRLAHEALRQYFTVRFDQRTLAPKGLAMKDNQFVIDGEAAAMVFRMGRDFAVAEQDRERAVELERQVLDQFGHFLVIDGSVWTPSFEFVYCATPAVGRKSGTVYVVNAAAHRVPDGAPYIARHPSWSNPAARFFSALSTEAAAEYAGIPLDRFPNIEVMDTSCVSADFEALELERCARLVLADLSAIPPDHLLLDPRTRLVGLVGTRDVPSSKDELADILSEISTAARTLDSKALKKVTPDHIDDFVARWNSRPIDTLDIGGPSFK